MIVREYFDTREDGVKLYCTYSNLNLKIEQVETGAIYNKAVDVEHASFTYRETNEPILEPIPQPQEDE